MSAPRVSVLMSVLNAQPYISESIESILSQTLKDFELVIVDDGSMDNTWAVISDYAAQDSRITPVRNQKNIGTSPALNRGLALARGRYITRQDGDDYSVSDRLARQAAFLEANPDVGAVGTAVLFVDSSGTPGQVSYTIRESEEIQQTLIDHMCLCGPTVMVRRECFETVGFYFHDNLSYTEDYDLCLRLAEVTRIANLPAPLYHYRQHPNSVSHRKRYRQMLNKAIALEQAFHRRFGSEPPPGQLEIVARDYLRAAYLGFASGERSSAQDSFERAVNIAPEICDSGTLIEDVILRYAGKQLEKDPFAIIEALFTELFPLTPHIARAKSRILSRLHMKEVFEAEKQGRFDRVSEHWWTGVRHDPHWLANRGVWAIGLRCLLGRQHGANRNHQE